MELLPVEARLSSETSFCFYQNKWRHIPENFKAQMPQIYEKPFWALN
jgi:hypothetical protein